MAYDDLHLLASAFLAAGGKHPGCRCRRCGDAIDLDDPFGLSESVCRRCCAPSRAVGAPADPERAVRRPVSRVAAFARALTSR